MYIKDILGQEVTVGDFVAFINVGYKELKVGIVKKVTRKGVTVKFNNNSVANRSCGMFVKVDLN